MCMMRASLLHRLLHPTPLGVQVGHDGVTVAGAAEFSGADDANCSIIFQAAAAGEVSLATSAG